MKRDRQPFFSHRQASHENRKEITIDRTAVSRAIRKPLEAYYKAVGSSGYDGNSERPGNWEENEDLFKAIFKSKYVSTHLDWLYALQLVFAVIDHNSPLKPEEFAEKLEKIIDQTAGQRDYLAIFPLAFNNGFGFFGMRSPLARSVTIGDFTFSPAAPTVKAVNKIIAKHKFPPIDESRFEHATRTSHKAFSHEMLVTFTVHGAEDNLRFSAQMKFNVLRRLIEIFANLFADIDSGLGSTRSANHFFLLSKTTEELRRLPTGKPSSFDFKLSADLLNSIKRPEFNEFFKEILLSRESMYDRIRNAIKFFSMAFNTNDTVTSFLFYVISIESIFSRDKNSPIKTTLADLASILCFPPEQRIDAHQMIREAYDLRSSIVHSGASSVDIKDAETARSIAARAIYCSLFLCKKLRGQGKLEDSFFNHLRDRKLGVAKEIIPRAIWSLPKIGADNK